MVYLIDASNIAHMCLFVSGLNNETFDNENLHGMFYHIFLTKLNNFIKETDPKNIWMCWDSPTGKDWRKKIFPPYNQNRKAQKEDRSIQVFHEKLLPNLKLVLEYYPINNVQHPDGEADDIIYTLCKQFKDEDLIKVVSSDGDLKQLLLFFPNVLLYNPRFKRIEEKPTEDFIKLKALVGDSSDGIPGIYRIGEKTAPSYLNGEKSLNEEQQLQFEKFIEIIDLRRFGNSSILEDYFKTYVAKKVYRFFPDKIEWFLIQNRCNDHYYKWSEIKGHIERQLK